MMIQQTGKNYHSILGIDPDASPEDIKRSYRRLAKKFHPDINPSADAHDRFIEISEAYEILINRDLAYYYRQKRASVDTETVRAEYDKARDAAREKARRYARMKYEKFKQEQEVFKKSGWHDVILTLRYMIRILVFPLIAFLIIMPLISEAVAEHPSGFVMFWLFATILVIFISNNWKNYFRLDQYYYGISGLIKLALDSFKLSREECYYCSGHQAVSFPYKLSLFRIRNILLRSYGGLYGRSAGMDRVIKTVRIPRSRKALIVHGSCSILKIICLAFCIYFFKSEPFTYFGIPAGIIAGTTISWLVSALFSTRPKLTCFLSYGMIIKFTVWLVCIWFIGKYAIILLFFDPMVEVILRQASGDRLFIPLVEQHPRINHLLKNRYQVYLELPIWSVLNPLFRWLF